MTDHIHTVATVTDPITGERRNVVVRYVGTRAEINYVDASRSIWVALAVTRNPSGEWEIPAFTLPVPGATVPCRLDSGIGVPAEYGDMLATNRQNAIAAVITEIFGWYEAETLIREVTDWVASQ